MILINLEMVNIFGDWKCLHSQKNEDGDNACVIVFSYRFIKSVGGLFRAWGINIYQEEIPKQIHHYDTAII